MLRALSNLWARAPKMLVATAVMVVACAAVSIATHDRNVTYGDDFALYLRQSRALLDGDVSRVVDDNAFLVTAKGDDTPEFSPMVYPWVTPLLMVPFVRLFGATDWANLKLAEVFFLCVWVVVFMHLLRRRVPLVASMAITACVAFNVQYAGHTNSVLSEIPYLMMATLLFVVVDRVQQRHSPLRLPWPAAWLVGIAGCLVFNTRREGLAIIPALLVWQLATWWRSTASEPPGRRERITLDAARPYATFAASAFLFQITLPSTLVPSYEGSSITKSARNLAVGYRERLGDLLGLEWAPALMVLVLLALAVAGAVRRLRAGNDDVLFLTFVAASTFFAAGHRIVVTRYLMLFVPFLLYLVYHGWVWLMDRFTRRTFFQLVPLMAVLATTSVVTVDELRTVHDQRSAGVYQLGPGAPQEDAGFEAVLTYTGTDDVVAFFKGRLMSLVTNRRSLQTMQPEVILAEADYYLQRYDQFDPPTGGFSPFLGVPQFDEGTAALAGLVEVWRNDRWVLWKVPQP